MEGGLAIAAVSDGHGSARYFRSDVGSRLAVSTAVAAVRDFLERNNAKAESFATKVAEVLPVLLVSAWRNAVDSHLASNAFTEKELEALWAADGGEAVGAVKADPRLAYGATLLVAAVLDEAVVYLQLGDGDVLVVAEDGGTSRPLPGDSRLIGNQTTSLCEENACDNFRVSVVTAIRHTPALILLSTDGYSNSFRSDDDFVMIGRDYLEMVRSTGLVALLQELPRILEEASRHGSGDDITLVILRPDSMEQNLVPAAGLPGVRSTTRAEGEDSGGLNRVPAASAPKRKRFWWMLASAVVLAALLVGIYLGRRKLLPAAPQDVPSLPKAVTSSNSAASARPLQIQEAHWTLRVESSQHELPLLAGLKISRADLGLSGETMVAEVVEQGGGLALKNLSRETWKIRFDSGALREFPPHSSVPLKRKMETTMGGVPVLITPPPAPPLAPSQRSHARNETRPQRLPSHPAIYERLVPPA